jgi:predicted nucleic acid-binding protein
MKFLGLLSRRIRIVPREETKLFMEKAKAISPDVKDIPYFALALKLNCALWSNDKKLKDQDKVKIYSTEEIMKL